MTMRRRLSSGFDKPITATGQLWDEPRLPRLTLCCQISQKVVQPGGAPVATAGETSPGLVIRDSTLLQTTELTLLADPLPDQLFWLK